MKKINKIIVILICLYSCTPQQALCLDVSNKELLSNIVKTTIQSTAIISGTACVSTFAHESGHALTAKLFGCYKSMYLGGEPKRNKKPLFTLKPLNIHIEGLEPFCGSTQVYAPASWKDSLISLAGPIAGVTACVLMAAHYTKNRSSFSNYLCLSSCLHFASQNLLNLIPFEVTPNQSRAVNIISHLFPEIHISDGGHIVINHCDEKTAKKILAYGKLIRSTLDYVMPVLISFSPILLVAFTNYSL